MSYFWEFSERPRVSSELQLLLKIPFENRKDFPRFQKVVWKIGFSPKNPLQIQLIHSPNISGSELTDKTVDGTPNVCIRNILYEKEQNIREKKNLHKYSIASRCSS